MGGYLGLSGNKVWPYKNILMLAGMLEFKMRAWTFFCISVTLIHYFFIWAFECFLLKNIRNTFHWETSPFYSAVVLRQFCFIKYLK